MKKIPLKIGAMILWLIAQQNSNGQPGTVEKMSTNQQKIHYGSFRTDQKHHHKCSHKYFGSVPYQGCPGLVYASILSEGA